MSANPRKFSEKIALQQQKQAEGTAAYEQIMREVLATTRLAIVKPMQPKPELQNHPNGLNPLKESDPGNSINLKNALMNLEDIKHSIEKPQASYTPNMVNVNMGGHSREQSPMRHLHPQQHSKRKKFSADRHREFSPYATPHLLALDPGWRRVSSDSAIHATVQSGNDANSRVTTSDAKNQGGPINQNTALLLERNLRPRSCEMAGVSMNGYPPTVPIQIPPFNNPSYLSIPPQTNHSSGSLPNIKCSAQQMPSPASNHSTTNYVEAGGQPPMMGQPFTYMAVRSMDGGNLVMQGSGGGAVYLGHQPGGSYVNSQYGNSQMGSLVAGVPSQNGHFVLQNANIMTPQTLPTNQVIGYSEVAPPPYPYPKSSSLPPTSPPPSITLTDVECQGRTLETILMESPALNLTEDMYSPSWERFLQSPGLKSPSMVYATPHHLSHQIANPPPQSSGYLMSGGSPSPVMQIVQSGGNYQTPMTCANTNQWTGSINNNNNNIHNINNNNNNKAIVQPQNASITSGNNNNNINLSPFFRNSGVQILAKNDPPPPSYESLSAAQSQTNNPGQTLIDDLFLPNKRNPLLRQDAHSSILPGDLEDFPSLSCLGDSFEDVELMNAEDLLKLGPLEIEDFNLLSSSTCTVPNEEFLALDKNC